jgi:prevent-host-death family protein
MKTVTARQANQAFSQLLGEVEAGTEVVVTKHGRPVARIVPYRPPEMTPERKEAIEAAIKMMHEGILKGPLEPLPTRDEMHER